ncbi:MAG TPA: sigma-70 family RNA polymerase sigma factor, partial [Acidimicrobiales bacterium]|nr:sigma-70 family RNA polymerase sigma factor [Acidimicrobiales bacterium]
MTQLEGTAVLGVAIGEGDVDAELDRALVVRAQAGDTAAFGQLYLRYHRRICRLAERRLHDRHEAEDVTQEAFTRAWRALPTFGGERAFYPWLAVITVHLCTDVVRHRRHAAAHTGSLDRVAPPTEGADAGVVAATDHRIVAGAFDRLSTRHQRILRLREDSGWSYARIAEHEGLGLHAVEALLWRARQALKREYLALAQDRLGAVAGAGIVAWASLRRLASLPRRLARHVAAATGRMAAATGRLAAATGRLAAAMGPASASVLVAVGVALPAAPVVMAAAAHAGPGAAPSSPATPPPSSPSVGGGSPGPATGA